MASRGEAQVPGVWRRLHSQSGPFSQGQHLVQGPLESAKALSPRPMSSSSSRSLTPRARKVRSVLLPDSCQAADEALRKPGGTACDPKRWTHVNIMLVWISSRSGRV